MSIFKNEFLIQQVISRFANSFDLKDWDGLSSCLSQSLYVDYSDLRGTPPKMMTASEYVRLRREALQPLKTHHLSGNFEIQITNEYSATCRFSMAIWRESDNDEFITHCVYHVNLIKETDDWKINRIAQKVLWNIGKAAVHVGINSKSDT